MTTRLEKMACEYLRIIGDPHLDAVGGLYLAEAYEAGARAMRAMIADAARKAAEETPDDREGGAMLLIADLAETMGDEKSNA